MDGGRRKLKSLGGPLKAAGGTGGAGSGRARAIYSSRPVSTPILRAEPVAYRAAERSAAEPRKVAFPAVPPVLTRSGIGWAAVALLFVTTGVYGATIGQRWNDFGAVLAAGPSMFAAGSGLILANIDVQGRKILTDDEIVSAIGAKQGESFVFLDADAARARLMQNPLVVSATVRKLYPDTIAVSVVEREPYALWQRGQKMSVIAVDGTVIEGIEEGRFANLPLLVGQGADTSAKALLAQLEPYPELRKNIYAMVRVGDRRWNLRLTNGMDVKLPERDVEEALALFVKLDAAHQLKDRDISELDLRRPGVPTVRLSDEAAAELAAKPAKKAAGT